MLLYIYSIRDSAAQVYGRPFYLGSPGIAVRSFSDMVNDPADGQNDLFKHAKDFELFELGTFDDSNAKLDLYDAPKPICTGSSVQRSN